VNRINEMVGAGADVVRHTGSFGNFALHEDRVLKARANAASSAEHFLDLPGEKLRLAAFAESPTIPVEDGERLVLSPAARPVAGPARWLPVAAERLELEVGSSLFVGDGDVSLEVVRELAPECFEVRVAGGGTIEQGRGLASSDAALEPSCITDRDLELLSSVASSEAFDGVMLSFVASPSEVMTARRILDASSRQVKVFAKIETHAGVQATADIAAVADGLVAGRGDLALYAGPARLHANVTAVVQAGLDQNVTTVVATQVIESLMTRSLPSRAEMCDIAHWVEAGCQAFMLARETAFGRDPIRPVAYLRAFLS
jgi:pyruvate kinase